MVDIASKNKIVEKFVLLESMFNDDGRVATVSELMENRRRYEI